MRARRLLQAARGPLVALAAAIPLAATAAAPQEDALPQGLSAPELLERTYENLYGGDFIQVMKLTTRGRSGRSITRRLQIVRKQSAEPGRAMVRFLEPGDVRGTSMLVIEREARYDDVFVYLPAFRRTRRVSAAQRADSFFGTDFSYEDLEPKKAVDYDSKIVGGDAVGSVPCVVIEVRARPHMESGYERTTSCVDTQRGVALWTDFYRKGQLWKRLQCEPASIREVGRGKFLPFRFHVETLAAGSETVLETESHEMQDDIPDALFSDVNLQRGDEKSDRLRSEKGQ